jgi:vitamin K-dependent gamma-carboxylase-like protein/DCC1-like thiol-disulfide oxidoreductase
MPVLDRTSATASSSVRIADSSRPSLGFLARIAFCLRDAYSLDLRSLALFRIALGAVLIGDLLVRASDLTVFYTDFGVLPRAALLDHFSEADRFSIHLLSGQFIFQAALFLFAGLLALMLMLGIRTRLAALASWFMLVSVQMRNPAILQGGDVYLRVLLFIAIFLPLGAVYSVDSALSPVQDEERKRGGYSYFSTPGLALIAQIAMLYGFAVLLKTAPEWRKEYSAVYYALSIQQMSTPVGHFLLHFPKLLPWLTRETLLHEGCMPFLLLTPILAGPARLLAVVLIFALHIGLGLSIRLGHFPYIACLAALPLIPTWFWQRRWLTTRAPWITGQSNGGAGVKIFYDAGCPFCAKVVSILKTFLVLPRAEALAAQDFPATELEMSERRSWIVVNPDGARCYKWRGFAALVEHSPILHWFAPVLQFAAIERLGNNIYASIETRREQLSKATTWIRAQQFRNTPSPAVTVFSLLFILYVFLWNLSSLTRVPFQPWEDSIGLTLGLDQRWDMFAPNPLTYDGWYVIEGRLRDGRTVNVIHPDQPVTFSQPRSIADQYKNERWRKYLMNLSLSENTDYRLYYGRYLCRSWNDGFTAMNPRALMTFDIYFMAHQNSIKQPPAGFSRDLLWHHECFK